MISIAGKSSLIAECIPNVHEYRSVPSRKNTYAMRQGNSRISVGETLAYLDLAVHTIAFKSSEAYKFSDVLGPAYRVRDSSRATFSRCLV